MGIHFRSATLFWLLVIAGDVWSDSSAMIAPTDNWSAEVAEARRAGLPIVILFTDKQCGNCERLKKEFLEPLARNRWLDEIALIRELDIRRGGKIRDFDGEKVRTRVFVKRYDVYATPTLLLVDHQGNARGTPIVGFNNPGDFMPYLEDLIGDIGDPHRLSRSQEAIARKVKSS